jgi:hypothetical protein
MLGQVLVEAADQADPHEEFSGGRGLSINNQLIG